MPVCLLVEVIIRAQKGRKRSDNSNHNCHGMRFRFETFVKLDHSFIQNHFVNDGLLKLSVLRLRRQLSIKQQVTGFHVIGVFSQSLNFVSTIHQFSLVTIDVSYGRHATGGACVTRVVSGQASLVH